ncbi:hypothetical protein [Catenuloplanes atrovinosus]|uniref:Glycosyl hydrolase family 32 N-terminal domain-containing protein n=1 Tax=Catenuloplanes atrovinosus TaxID=137266 RepID=A0AAE3YME3_9ACTN|nr:hypothetical protein [Catenuloplanes atrovinosus]MDR7275722.1 hypothetical protein [Catenuloplanes atrovinosus]
MRFSVPVVAAALVFVTAAPAPAAARPVTVFSDSFGTVAGWDRQGVVLAQSLPWETSLMQDPSIIVGQGGGPRFKMWYGSIGNVGYAYSADGVAWTKHPDPVVAPTLPTESNALTVPSVVYRDGVYHMSYFGVDAGGVGRIHYAEATDPAGPWTKFGPIVVPTAEWEDDYIYNSSLLYDERQRLWKMWYTAGRIASAGGEPEFICLATATDPRGPWTKSPSNPLISPMNDGGWASLGIGGPNVRMMPDGSYQMVVVGWQADYPSRGGRLTSRDGVRWTLDRSAMTLDLGVAGGVEDSMIYRQYVVNVGGTDWVWYNVKNHRPGWNETINLARWSRGLPIVDPSKWTMTQGPHIPNGASFEVRNGRAHALGNAPAGHPQTLQGNRRIAARNYTVAAEITPMDVAPGDRDNVLMARYTDRGNYYYAGIASWGNRYAIGKLVDGTNTKLTGVGAASEIHAGTTYRLRLVVSGSTISLYDGGTLVASVTDESLAPAASYVGMQTTASTGHAAFDNVAVTVP